MTLPVARHVWPALLEAYTLPSGVTPHTLAEVHAIRAMSGASGSGFQVLPPSGLAVGPFWVVAMAR